MEVGDQEQALRVVKSALTKTHISATNKFEIWRDWPAIPPQPGEEASVEIGGRMIPVKGAGKMRVVVLFRIEEEMPKREAEKLATPKVVLPSIPGSEGLKTMLEENEVEKETIWDVKRKKCMERKAGKARRKRERRERRNVRRKECEKGGVGLELLGRLGKTRHGKKSRKS